MTAEPLTPAAIRNRLGAALSTIDALYDEMLEPVSRSGQGGSNDTELNRTERIIAVREEVGYQTWATIEAICDEHAIEEPTCSEYEVTTHTAWLRAHADDFAAYSGALDALQEMEDCAEAVTNVVFGHHRPRLALGACTITACDGIVRDAGQDDAGHQIARCTHCGATANVRWWAERMRMPVRDTLTGAELIVLAHQQYGRRLTPAAIRQAVRRDMLHPVKDTRPQAFTMADCIGYLTRAS